MDTAGWDYIDFKEAIGGKEKRRTIFTKRHHPTFEDRIFGGVGLEGQPSAQEYYSGNCPVCSNTNVIAFYDGAFANDDGHYNWLREVTVHELAHAWDSANGDSLSHGMQMATDSYYEAVTECDSSGFTCGYKRAYRPQGGKVSPTGAKNHYEDFAEAVAAAVYPSHKPEYDQNGTRINYIQSQFRQYNRPHNNP